MLPLALSRISLEGPILHDTFVKDSADFFAVCDIPVIHKKRLNLLRPDSATSVLCLKQRQQQTRVEIIPMFSDGQKNRTTCHWVQRALPSGFASISALKHEFTSIVDVWISWKSLILNDHNLTRGGFLRKNADRVQLAFAGIIETGV